MYSIESFFRFGRLILSAEYKFAKTMPKNLHWYTLRDTWKDDDFIFVVKFIREYGNVEAWGSRKYVYFRLNGFKYWTMGAPINKNGEPHTILINKAKINYNSEYDLIADQYDLLFCDKISKSEEKELFELLDIKGSVLDVGCGNGLALDYICFRNYVGIDPSREMLKILYSKNRGGISLINTKFEDYYGVGFDTIISLFGSASYIDPCHFIKIKHMLNKNGKAYLMFYKDEYNPVTHIKTGINPKVYKSDSNGIEFNNFKLVIIE